MKKLVIGGAIAAILLIAGVWIGFDLFLVRQHTAGPIQILPEVQQEIPFYEKQTLPVPLEIKEFFQSLAKDARDRESAKIADRFDLVRLYALATKYDLSPDPTLPKLIGSFHSRLYSTLLDAFARGGFGLPWDSIEIVRTIGEGKNDIIVMVRHYAGDHVVPVKWQLTRTAKGLQIVDGEDLLLKLKVSHQFAWLLSASQDEKRAEEVLETVKSMRDATATLRNNKPREADLLLKFVHRVTLPSMQMKSSLAIEGLIAAVLNDESRIGTITKEIENQPLGDLMSATASGKNNSLDQRLSAAKRYESVFGYCPITMSVRIQSLIIDGKIIEAQELFQTAITLFPDSSLLEEWR